MEKYFQYDCKRCGSCCRNVNLCEEMKMLDRGDGICKHLNENNLCRIYDKRPNLCNGQYVYEHFYSQMTVADYHKMIAKLCEQIRGNQCEKLYKKISNA